MPSKEFDNQNNFLLNKGLSKVFKSFCSDRASFDGKCINIRENGKIVTSINAQAFYNGMSENISVKIDALIDNIKLLKEQGYDLTSENNELNGNKAFSIINSYGNNMFNDFSEIMLLYQKSITALKNKSPEYTKFCNTLDLKIEELRAFLNKSTFKVFVGFSIYDSLVNPNKVVHQLFDEHTNYTSDEAIAIVKKFFKRDEKENNILAYFSNNPTDFIRKLEKNGFIKPNKSTYCHPSRIRSGKKNLNYESQFLTTKSCIAAYYYDRIDLKHLKQNFDIRQLFDACYLVRNNNLNIDEVEKSKNKSIYFIDNENGDLTYKDHAKMIVEMVKLVKPKGSCSVGFWNYYINGILSYEDMKEILSVGDYINIEDLASKLISRHKIADEVNSIASDGKAILEGKDAKYYDYIFDDEKTFNLLSPELIIKEYNREKVSDTISTFVHKCLFKYYRKNNIDISSEFMKAYIEFINGAEVKEEEKLNVLKNLYEDKVIDSTQLKNQNIPNSIVQSLIECEKTNDDAVVDFYNNGIIDQELILEEYDEEQIAYFIKNGMNANVIGNYYGCEDIIKFVINNKINGDCDLSCLMQYMNLDKISELYQPSKNSEENNDTEKLEEAVFRLQYDDLYKLVECKLISPEDADKIDQEYDYKMDLDMLMDKGLIVGDKHGIFVEQGHDGVHKKGLSNGNQGQINDSYKQSLYYALDKSFVEFGLTSHVLKHYNLVVFPKLKIALMEPGEEGEGASYVMSIKLALDQIRNDEEKNGKKIVSPLKLYKNRTGIRSINGMQVAIHDRGWGYTLVKKMEKIHPNIDSLIYGEDDKDKKTEHKKNIDSKQFAIERAYIDSRLLRRNLDDIDVQGVVGIRNI